jgi:hypothetical protein
LKTGTVSQNHQEGDEERMPQAILELNRRHSPQTWVAAILESAKARSDDVVEQKLIEATLRRRFDRTYITAFKALSDHESVGWTNGNTLANLTYYVTTDPSRQSMQRYSQTSRAGGHSFLLVPSEQIEKATVFAHEEGIERHLAILSIESFVATIIIGLAMDENKDLFSILTEIVDIYNERLAEVETDLSLLIKVR